MTSSGGLIVKGWIIGVEVTGSTFGQLFFDIFLYFLIHGDCSIRVSTKQNYIFWFLPHSFVAVISIYFKSPKDTVVMVNPCTDDYFQKWFTCI